MAAASTEWVTMRCAWDILTLLLRDLRALDTTLPIRREEGQNGTAHVAFHTALQGEGIRFMRLALIFMCARGREEIAKVDMMNAIDAARIKMLPDAEATDDVRARGMALSERARNIAHKTNKIDFVKWRRVCGITENGLDRLIIALHGAPLECGKDAQYAFVCYLRAWIEDIVTRTAVAARDNKSEITADCVNDAVKACSF